MNCGPTESVGRSEWVSTKNDFRVSWLECFPKCHLGFSYFYYDFRSRQRCNNLFSSRLRLPQRRCDLWDCLEVKYSSQSTITSICVRVSEWVCVFAITREHTNEASSIALTINTSDTQHSTAHSISSAFAFFLCERAAKQKLENSLFHDERRVRNSNWMKIQFPIRSLLTISFVAPQNNRNGTLWFRWFKRM